MYTVPIQNITETTMLRVLGLHPPKTRHKNAVIVDTDMYVCIYRYIKAKCCMVGGSIYHGNASWGCRTFHPSHPIILVIIGSSGNRCIDDSIVYLEKIR